MSIFTSNQRRKVFKNKFDLSHDRKQTMRFGQITPILCQEVLPGSHHRIKSEHLVRLAPTIAPVMHRINIDKYFFYVPNRQLWDQWKTFVTGGDDGTATPAHPTYTFAEADKAKLAPGGS